MGDALFQKKSEVALARASKKELIALVQDGQKLLQKEREAAMNAAALLTAKDQEIAQKNKAYNDLKGLYEELKEKHIIRELSAKLLT